MQVEHNSATLLGNHAHGLVQSLAATAVGGKHIARRAAGMHPHQHGMRANRPRRFLTRGQSIPPTSQPVRKCGTVLAKLPAHQRNVALAAIYFALVSDHAELAVARLNAALAGAHNIPLIAQPVADQLRHGKNRQPVLLAEWYEIGNAR